MENPQAQMPQSQPGMEQAQALQQGGQDQQMQQLLQAVQQMIQQGAQPVDVAAELLGQQVPPEVIMQVFVQMGLPEQDAQMAIEQAMQGGQQPQSLGEEQMEGAASNPQETEGAPMMPPGMEGQPPMAFGGQPRRMLRQRAKGGGMDPQQELQAVIEQVQGMMEQGADARQVMEQIQAAAQQGQISPEVATQVLEQLSGMQETANPQGSDMAMTDASQDPQVPTSNVATPEANMMRFGGNLKKLMQKAYGGNAIPPSLDSKNYAQERANMFVNSVKNNAFKSSLDDEFPSLVGNQMAYGGNLPKAVDGISMKDGKLTIDPTAYKSESDYKAAIYDWNSNPANKDNQVTNELFTANKWTQQPDANASYKYDPATKQYIKQAPAQNTNQFQFQEGDVLNRDAQGAYVTRKDGSMMRIPAYFGNQNQTAGYNVSQSAINPVAYQNPLGNSLMDQLYASANPWARLIAGSGNRGYDPRITGTNLPGGMSGADFLGNVGGLQGLTTGMTGTVGDQTWRVTGAEKFKEGSIWKGNRRKGVRYQIDWGDAAAINGQGTPGTNPQLTGPGPQNWNNVDDNENTIPDYLEVKNNEFPSATTVSNQNTVTPSSTNVVNPASEVDAVDQTVKPTLEQMRNAATAAGDEGTWNKPVNKQVALNVDYRNLKGDARKIAMAEEYDRRYRIPIIGDKYQSSSDENDNRYDRKDFRTDRSYYKALYPNLDNREIRNLSKTYELGEDPYDMVGFQTTSDNSKVYSSKKEMRAARKNNKQEDAAIKSIYNNETKKWEPAPKKAYGGNVDPIALENAIALINRAFGGMIPKAEYGNMGNQGYIEESKGKKFKVDWNAAADVYATKGAQLANFANNVSSYEGNQERDLAKHSALNRPFDDYSTMDQGIYDQWGNFKPNDLVAQLNSTDVYRQNQTRVYAYGGRLYEIGGEVELDDNELAELSAAGFNFRRS